MIKTLLLQLVVNKLQQQVLAIQRKHNIALQQHTTLRKDTVDIEVKAAYGQVEGGVHAQRRLLGREGLAST